jgi:hypothetical protein
MTVSELIKILENHCPDAPIELCVFGHSFHSDRDKGYLGVMIVEERRGTVTIRQTIPGHDR